MAGNCKISATYCEKSALIEQVGTGGYHTHIYIYILYNGLNKNKSNLLDSIFGVVPHMYIYIYIHPRDKHIPQQKVQKTLHI